MTKSVLLTGASGYIAKHIALQLLEAGYHVRGTVRSLSRGAEVTEAVRPHLSDPSSLEDRLTFVALDLSSDDGWDAAMEGMDVLMHTASPFPITQPKDADDLIRPAVDGTLRALRAAHKAGIGRAIVTSSVAAISGTDLPPEDVAFDETNWTDPEDDRVVAYSKSKTYAEMAAWDFVRDEAPDIALTCINPALVVGTPLDRNYGTSIEVVERTMRGKDPMVPDIGFGVVDVRDVAALHVTVIDRPDTHGQRIMAVENYMTFQEIAKALKAAFPDRRIPTRVAPHLLIRLLAIFDPAIRSILPSLGRREKFDNARAKSTLGRGLYRGEQAIVATGQYLVDEKIV